MVLNLGKLPQFLEGDLVHFWQDCIVFGTMMLRSATNAAAQAAASAEPCVTIGTFVELRSEDSTEKPWLARILDRKFVGGRATDVECEWLWHPKESIRDYGLTDCELNTYGSREVFLGSDTGEAAVDWNPIDSIKWQVHVFTLEEYKAIAANGFQMRLPPSSTGRQGSTVAPMALLESNRCWYYRQRLDVEKRTLSPKLERVIHRPNPAFHAWCNANGVSVEAPTPLDVPSDSTSPPPRTILVPENPERIYFRCSTCLRRFETRQGDCLTPEALSDPKYFRLKPQINQPDVDITCPMCTTASTSRASDDAPPVKRVRVSTPVHRRSSTPGIFDTVSDTEGEKSEEIRREERGKLARYERFHEVFKKCIDEAALTGPAGALQYYDAKILCDEFLDKFEEYAAEVHLTAKMSHQKLHEIFQNLKRENNIDLRRRIVVGELPLYDLVRSDVKDLAPESLKRRREAEARKYFKQQVLLQPEMSAQKIFRKTHKGLEAVDEEDTAFRSPGLSRSPSPEHSRKSLNSVSETQPRQEDSLRFSSTSTVSPHSHPSSLTETTATTLEDLIASLRKSNRQRVGVVGGLVDLESPLAQAWQAADTLWNDTLLTSPMALTAVPNREQTYMLLTEKLRAARAKEK